MLQSSFKPKMLITPLILLLCFMFGNIVITSTKAIDKVDAFFNPSTLFDGRVQAIAVQPDGKVLIGGLIDEVNGSSNTHGLARLNVDGSLDSNFQVKTDSIVFSIAIQPDGKILIAGGFVYVNGSFRPRVARLNSDGSVDTSFLATPLFSSPFSVLALGLQPDGKILVSSLNIIRLNSNGSQDTTFNANANDVRSFSIQGDGKIIIGGSFTSVNGTNRNRIARLNGDGTLDVSFDPGTGADLTVFTTRLQSDGKVIIAGIFDNFNGTVRDGISRLNVNGSLDATFSPIGDTAIFSMAIQSDGKIVVGGFIFGSGSPPKRVARFNTDGSRDNSFNFPLVGVNGNIDAVAMQADGKIIAGGNSYYLEGSSYFNLIRINTNGSVDSGFNPNVYKGADIYGLAIQSDGKIIIVGDLVKVSGTARGLVARLNADGSLDKNFVVNANNQVLSIAVQPDGKVIIGGNFTQINGVSRSNLARLNTDGSLDTSFNIGTGPDQVVRLIEVVQPNNKIIITGGFSNFNGITRQNIARLNTDGSLDQSFNPGTGLNSIASRLVVQPDGKIILGGFFTTYNGTPRNGIARINLDGSLDASFTASTSLSGGNSGVLNTIKRQPDGKLVIGGTFTSVNGVTRNNLARLNADGSLDTAFNPIPDQAISDVAIQPDNRIVVGGSFTRMNTLRYSFICRLNSDGSVDTRFNPMRRQAEGGGLVSLSNGTNTTVRLVAIQPYNKIVIAGSFTSIVAGGPTTGNNGRIEFATRLGIARYLPSIVPGDFDGDGRSDISVFRPSNGVWYYLNSSNGSFGAQHFGLNNDRIVPGDYDGDGRIDIAVFRPSDGVWYIQQSTDGFKAIQFGLNIDIPMPGDYDSDGKTDIAVFRNGTWYILFSGNGSFTAIQFGLNGDQPVTGDYDGDGRDDIAVFRPSDNIWYMLRSSAGFTSVQFGLNADKPVPADYDGDGKTDIAVYRPSNGVWYLLRSDLGFTGVQFGISSDIPVTGDYDGDGKADFAVYRDGVWYLLRSQQGFTALQFGLATDKPIPAAYVP